MQCLSPVVAKGQNGFPNPLVVACGRCRFCIINHAQEWAVRCVHESRSYPENGFLTLTYSPEALREHLADRNTLSLDHLQRFMKRYRRAVGPLRFFAGAEYGDSRDRPHFHVLVFGHRFSDLRPARPSASGKPLYTSEQLESLWGYGYARIGDVSFQSASYVARYCLKKMGALKAGEVLSADKQSYVRVDAVGEEYLAPREFAVMSRNPGIGSAWFDRFGVTDALNFNRVRVDGRFFSVPKYYLDRARELQPEAYERCMSVRASLRSDPVLRHIRGDNKRPVRKRAIVACADRRLDFQRTGPVGH